MLMAVSLATKELGIGESTTWRLIRDGRLGVVKIGRRTLIPERELSAFVRRSMVKARRRAKVR